MISIARGATRIVILTKSRAYKLPRPLSWAHFLHGLLANIQEATFSRTGWPELCPVLWSLPGGFLVVMPRLEVCSEADEPSPEEFEAMTDREDYRVPAEHKASSWGWLDGRLVAIDYGS